MNGILVVNKPAGITSQQVVSRVRRLSGIKKIGHTGTLDPEVRGVLPLCIGQATRLAEYMLEQSKGYRGEMSFGTATDTQDATGTVVERLQNFRLKEEDIRRVFASYIGTIMQTPPGYSAIKIDGKRAYQRVRQGESVEIPPRQVTIYSLQIESMDLLRDDPRIVFSVECSKGTYIRTLCHDIGRSLGVPAHMVNLVRTRSGPYHIEDAHSLETIEEACSWGLFASLLVSASTAVSYMPCFRIQPTQERRVFNGMPLRILPHRGYDDLAVGQRVRVENVSGQLVAIYCVQEHTDNGIEMKPEKVFRE